MEIYYATSFIRGYRKLSADIRAQAKSREILFRREPFHKSLKTHKLNGVMDGLYSFSVDYRYRIIFVLKSKDVALFVRIGTHDVYE